MLHIYGSDLCPDCIKCKQELEAAGVPFEYLNISENLRHLKQFLKLRDESELFADIRKNDKIGIPCILRGDGSLTLEWEAFIK